MTTVTVSSKYQVVIPLEVRSVLGIAPGGKFNVVSYEDRVELIPVKRMRAMRGFVKGVGSAVGRDEDRE